MSGPAPAGVVVAGVHGFGRHHLQALLQLIDAPGGTVPTPYLAGLCDPVPPADLPEPLRTRLRDVPVSDRLGPLLRAVDGPAVAIVATPIHTHVDLALTALGHGAAVLLEKPPAASMSGFRRLLDAAATADLPVQVGFQDLGSPALALVRRLIRDGAVGRVIGVAATGAWSRDSGYYARARWAGRRRLDGADVVDGALTNPFAHAVAAALAVDGTTGEQDVLDVELELYRAHAIEADDTSCLRVRTEGGTTVVVAVTLAAAREEEPRVVVHGTGGRIDWRYKRGRVTVLRGGRQVVAFPPPQLLANLLEHVADRHVPLLVPLADAGAFTAVLEAVRLAPDPVPVPPSEIVATSVPGPDGTAVERRAVRGVEDLVARAGERLQLFSELGVDWRPRSGSRVPA